jgi:hypothetical protein
MREEGLRKEGTISIFLEFCPGSGIGKGRPLALLLPPNEWQAVDYNKNGLTTQVLAECP